MTVGIKLPCISIRVLSLFGSHPIWRTSNPCMESAAERFAEVVDLPIPPFPYRAICFIMILLAGNLY
jgi:hypothetical protein